MSETHDKTAEIEGMGFPCTVMLGDISPRAIWENKDYFIGLATTSREEIWPELEDEQQEALLRIVASRLEVFNAEVDTWGGQMGLKAEGGQYLNVDFTVTNQDITDEIVRYSEQLEAGSADAVAEAMDLIGDI